jgi:hypothetical protein
MSAFNVLDRLMLHVFCLDFLSISFAAFQCATLHLLLALCICMCVWCAESFIRNLHVL